MTDLLALADTIERLHGAATESICRKCGDSYVLRYGHDPTPLCDPCAHAFVDNHAPAFAAALRELDWMRTNCTMRMGDHATFRELSKATDAALAEGGRHE